MRMRIEIRSIHVVLFEQQENAENLFALAELWQAINMVVWIECVRKFVRFARFVRSLVRSVVQSMLSVAWMFATFALIASNGKLKRLSSQPAEGIATHI